MTPDGMPTIDALGLDPETSSRLQSEASRRGISVTDLVRTLLRESVSPLPSIYHDLDALSGTWSAEDAVAFDGAIGLLRRIDQDLWR